MEHRKAFPCLGHSGLENLPKGSKLNKQQQTVQQASSLAPNRQGAEGSESKNTPPPPPKKYWREDFEKVTCQCFILPIYMAMKFERICILWGNSSTKTGPCMPVSCNCKSQRRTSYRQCIDLEMMFRHGR